VVRLEQLAQQVLQARQVLMEALVFVGVLVCLVLSVPLAQLDPLVFRVLMDGLGLKDSKEQRDLPEDVEQWVKSEQLVHRGCLEHPEQLVQLGLSEHLVNQESRAVWARLEVLVHLECLGSQALEASLAARVRLAVRASAGQPVRSEQLAYLESSVLQDSKVQQGRRGFKDQLAQLDP